MIIERKLQLDARRRPVLVRRAAAGRPAERLAREVALLRRIDDPGTVRVESVVHEPDGGLTVTTALPTGGSLADLRDPPLPASQLAAVLAAVAATLARAHRAGLVHGHLVAADVLLDGAGAPVLDGWADAADLLDDPPAGAPAPDPASDVAAVGQLLHDLAGDDARAAPLRALADRATAPDPHARPTMTAVAAVLATVAAEADDPPPHHLAARLRRAGTGRDRRPSRSRRTLELVGTVATGVVVAVVVAVTAVAPGERPSGPPPASTRTGPDEPSADAAGTPPSTWSTVPAPACLPLATADCPGPVEVAAGDVRAGTRRWSVAEPDDVVTLGRWACTEAPTPAVLRPDGGIWVYGRWATAGDDDVAARPVAVVRGAVDLTAVDGDGDGCHELGVTRDDGSHTVVDPDDGR